MSLKFEFLGLKILSNGSFKKTREFTKSFTILCPGCVCPVCYHMQKETTKYSVRKKRFTTSQYAIGDHRVPKEILTYKISTISEIFDTRLIIITVLIIL